MKDFTISSNNNIKRALEKLDNNKKGFLIVINDDNKVLGTMTDGDIRRALLMGYDVFASIVDIYNKKFDFLKIDAAFDTICEKFKSDKINFLPIVNKDYKLINIITKKQFHIILLEDMVFDLTFDFFSLDETKLEQEIYNRPWGFYKSTLLTSHAQSKIITVFPDEELSLQEHKKREEHWVVIKGKGKVILGESILEAYPGKYFYIPKGCKHKMVNNGDDNLIFAEVQLGEYFGEDDIIRYKDKYGRINKKDNR